MFTIKNCERFAREESIHIFLGLTQSVFVRHNVCKKLYLCPRELNSHVCLSSALTIRSQCCSLSRMLRKTKFTHQHSLSVGVIQSELESIKKNRRTQPLGRNKFHDLGAHWRGGHQRRTMC